MISMHRGTVRLLLLLTGVLLLAGCTPGDGAQVTSAPVPYEHQHEDGLLNVTMRIDDTAITSVDRIRLTIETSLDAAFALQPLELESALGGDWMVTASDPGVDVATDDGRTGRVLTFDLEPWTPGTLMVPAIDIPYAEPNAAEIDWRVLTLPAVSVEVTSVVADDTAVDLGSIRGAVEPRPTKWWIPVAIGAVLLLCVVIAMVLVITRIRRRRAERERFIRRTAHEVALARLQEVLDQDLIGQGRIKEFYVDVSFVLRRYIEDRFGLRAPEQTTEEFLGETRSAARLDRDDVEVLEQFLSHCDLVKFAAARPADHEIHATLQTVRTFIERTRIEEEQVVFDASGQRRVTREVADD